MTKTKKGLLSGVLALSMLASAGAAMGVTAYANTYEPVTASAAEKEDTAIWSKVSYFEEDGYNYREFSLIMYDEALYPLFYNFDDGTYGDYIWTECNIVTNVDGFGEQNYQVGEDVFGGYMGWFDLNDDDIDDLRGYYKIDNEEKTVVIDVVTTKNKIGFDKNVEYDCSYMFCDFNGKKINGLENMDTSEMTNMSYMFLDNYYLEELDLSTFDTSNVTDMSNMFYNCKSLTALDISNFDTSNVTTTSRMFANCVSLPELNVTSFNTENVTDMSHMFYNCCSLTELDVSSFNTENVTNMFCLFSDCSSLAQLDVTNFNTSNVTNMCAIFQLCESLQTIDVSNFDTSNATNMSHMFAFCSNLTEIDVSNFDTSNAITLTTMFQLCTSLKTLDLSNFDTRNAENVSYMFAHCYNLRELTLGENFVIAEKEDEDGVLTYPETMYMFAYVATEGYHYDEVLDIEYMDGFNMFTIYNAPAETQKYIEDNQELLYYWDLEDGTSQIVFETTKEPVNVFKSVIKSLQFTFLMGLELIVYIYTVFKIWQK